VPMMMERMTQKGMGKGAGVKRKTVCAWSGSSFPLPLFPSSLFENLFNNFKIDPLRSHSMFLIGKWVGGCYL